MITYKKQSITWLIMSESKVGNTANDIILWSQIRWCRIMAVKKLRFSATVYVKKADISYEWLEVFICVHISLSCQFLKLQLYP